MTRTNAKTSAKPTKKGASRRVVASPVEDTVGKELPSDLTTSVVAGVDSAQDAFNQDLASYEFTFSPKGPEIKRALKHLLGKADIEFERITAHIEKRDPIFERPLMVIEVFRPAMDTYPQKMAFSRIKARFRSIEGGDYIVREANT